MVISFICHHVSRQNTTLVSSVPVIGTIHYRPSQNRLCCCVSSSKTTFTSLQSRDLESFKQVKSVSRTVEPTQNDQLLNTRSPELRHLLFMSLTSLHLYSLINFVRNNSEKVIRSSVDNCISESQPYNLMKIVIGEIGSSHSINIFDKSLHSS